MSQRGPPAARWRACRWVFISGQIGEALMTSTFNIRPALEHARDFLAGIAPITPIKLDDALVVLIDACLSDAEMFGWLQTEYTNHTAGGYRTTLATTPPAALRASLEKANLPWAQIVQLLPVIFDLISKWQKHNPTPNNNPPVPKAG
jgi:hypothetical protein